MLSILYFLIQIVFGMLGMLFVLRLLAEASRADFSNPLCQLIYRLSNPVLAPIRRVLPNWRRINLAALLVAWLLMLIERVLLSTLSGPFPGFLSLAVLSLADLLDFVLVFYLVVIFVWSLLSLFQTDRRHPLLRLIGNLAEPPLRPLRGRVVAGGLDFSPWLAMVVLELLRLLLVNPLLSLGSRLALGG